MLQVASESAPAGRLPDAPIVATEAPLLERYLDLRHRTEALAKGLSADDCQVQGMADASPVKWHLAHTSWFFETFLLSPQPGYAPFDAHYAALFNSYYQGLGAPRPRAARGLWSRPTLAEVRRYRAHVDAAMATLLQREPAPGLLDLGLAHEQQHQELILTDVKYALWCSPLQPAYRSGPLPARLAPLPARWIERPGVLVEIGADMDGFAFDNERPRHRHWCDAHALASRTVTNGEYLDFIRDRGYETPALWVSDGWALVQREGWNRPLYWNEDLESHFTLRGVQLLDLGEPVCHLSWYEADAYARWAGARLPREQEWEAAAAAWPVLGQFAESGRLHPRAASSASPEFFGNVWEWTASPYVAYPGYRAPAGALGEYNGKFMCNQMVLRGGSCATPAGHSRASYRNFFPPHARWQFSGLRLARDLP
jgi:ergothioneine biosynthesis protein EgtB